MTRSTLKYKGFTQRLGSRAQVWHGTAAKTSGGLFKKDLKMNKHGEIVSLSKSKLQKRRTPHGVPGYTPKKGVFRLFTKKHGRKSKRHGGSGLSSLHSGSYPDSVGTADSTAPGTVFPTTLGGGRRRRRRGGNLGAPYPGSVGSMSSPSGLGAGQASLMQNGTPLNMALTHGGTRRHRRRRHGGTSNRSMGGLGSTALQLRAGNAN